MVSKSKSGKGTPKATHLSNSKTNRPPPIPTHPTPPNWPEIRTTGSSALALENLLEGQIFTIRRLWTSHLCKSYVTFLKTLPLTTTPGKPQKGEAVRVNDRFQVNDPHFAENLWSKTALKDLITRPIINNIELDHTATKELWGGEVVGLNPNIRIYRYTKGQFFDQHYDDSNNVNIDIDPNRVQIPGKTTWTLLLYLTSAATGCQGGETVFYPERKRRNEATPSPIVVELEVGMALLHRHGKECLLHEGKEVVEGEKWVVRSDLVVGRE